MKRKQVFYKGDVTEYGNARDVKEEETLIPTGW